MQFFLQLLKFVAPALVAWGASDKGDIVVNAIPDKIKEKIPVWAWPIITILVFGAAAILILKFLSKGKGKGKLFAWLLGGVAMYAFASSSADGVVMATALLTLTTGVGILSTASLTFLPERLWFSAATQLTGVKISTKDNGVIFDLDANGLTHVGLNRVFGQVTNGYILNLANAQIPAGNVLFEFTNSAAQTPVIYYDSDIQAPVDQMQFLQAGKVPLLTGGNEFRNFATLSLPSLAATDSITIQYADGSVQANMNRVDLQYKLGLTQSVVNTPVYQIDNFDRSILSVSVVAGAAQTGYIQRWTGVVGKINSNLVDTM